MTINQIHKKIKKMAAHLITEINDYIDFLLNIDTTNSKQKTKFDFSWAGGIRELSEKYTSVDLQHKSMEWR